MQRRWISLGGWCGPSLMLSKLGLTPPGEQLPFDMVRCTLDGIAEFTRCGFDNFFPENEENNKNRNLQGGDDATKTIMIPDPVSIWLLFRGWHTAFTHYDLNRPAVQHEFQQRFKRWNTLFQQQQQQKQPVTFLRTSISEDPLAEARFIPRLQQIFDETSNHQLDHRIVLVHHLTASDSSSSSSSSSSIYNETKPLFFINDRALMWVLRHDQKVEQEDPSASLFDKSESGYRKVISESSDESNWNQLQSNLPNSISNFFSSQSPPLLKPSSLLSRVEGIPPFRGTCVGFGSTESFSSIGGGGNKNKMKNKNKNKICLSCGDRTGHALLNRDAFDHADKEWTEEEDGVILGLILQQQQHQILQQPADQLDIVALVETAANTLKRGSNETLMRMKMFGLQTAL